MISYDEFVSILDDNISEGMKRSLWRIKNKSFKSAEEVVRFVLKWNDKTGGLKELYIRYAERPDKDIELGYKSRNFEGRWGEEGTEDAELEAGVSVNYLSLDDMGQDEASVIEIVKNVTSYVWFAGDQMDAWIMTGKHIGEGADGEPLLESGSIDVLGRIPSRVIREFIKIEKSLPKGRYFGDVEDDMSPFKGLMWGTKSLRK